MQSFENVGKIFNIDEIALYNTEFKRDYWQGDNISIFLMSIPMGKDTGAGKSMGKDRFIRIENGVGNIYFGEKEDDLKLFGKVNGHFAVIVPKGVWCNIENCGLAPLKIYCIEA